MVPVRVVQMTIDQVIGVVAVGDGFVTATGPVDVVGIVSAAIVLRSAGVGIGVIHFELMFHHRSIRVLMMEMAIVKVIDVVSVLNCGVPAVGAMFVSVVVMDVFGHRVILSFREFSWKECGRGRYS